MIRSTLAIVAVLILSACGSSADNDAPTAAELDQQFIDRLVESDVLPADTPADARVEVVKAGRTWCDTLGEIDPSETTMEAAMNLALGGANPKEKAETGLMLGAAVQVYCPGIGERFN